MDEAAVMLLSPDLPADRLEITYSVSKDTVSVEAQVVSAVEAELTGESVERFGFLVGDLVDDYTIDAASRRLTLFKTRSS